MKRLIVVLLSVFMLIAGGCTSISAGISMPVAGKEWEITLISVRTEKELPLFLGAKFTVSSSGTSLLVVETKFRNSNLQRSEKVTTKMVAIISQDGTKIDAVGGCLGKSLGKEVVCCVQCAVDIGTRDGKYIDTDTIEIVFPIKDEWSGQVFKFQFQDVPLIPFSLQGKAK